MKARKARSINLLTEDEESTAEFSGRVDWVVATQAALVNYDQNSGDVEEEERQGLRVVSYPSLTTSSSSRYSTVSIVWVITSANCDFFVDFRYYHKQSGFFFTSKPIERIPVAVDCISL